MDINVFKEVLNNDLDYCIWFIEEFRCNNKEQELFYNYIIDKIKDKPIFKYGTLSKKMKN